MVAVGDRGLDFAWSKPSIPAIKADGNTFVMRYLSWLPNGKVISKSEYDNYLNNGLAVGLNWEFAAGDQKGGAASGRIHGAEAYRQARSLGAPKGAAIYFSADWDVSASELPTVRAYWAAAASELQGFYRFGVYGGYRAVNDALDHNYLAWQTYAWSYGVWDTRASIRQYQNGVTVGGADCDRNLLMSTNNGLILPDGSTGGPTLDRRVIAQWID